MPRTGRGRGRARAEVAVARVLEKRLGALPVAAQFGRRLRIAEVVDELCPVRQVAPISHGEVIEALVANRLTAPAPLVQVEAWAAAMAVDEVYGIEPHLLNDDRLGRALDAIAPHLDEVTGSVGRGGDQRVRGGRGPAALGYDLDLAVRRLPGAGGGVPGTAVGASEGPPPGSEAGPDRAGRGRRRRDPGLLPRLRRRGREVAQVTGAMTALKKIAGPRTFLLAGDSKLISWANAAAMAAGQVAFVAPLAASRVPAGLFAALPAGAGTEVDYTAAAGRGQARRRAGHVPGGRGRRDGHPRPPQERPGGAPAPDPGVLPGERRRPGQGQGAEAGQGRHRAGQAGTHRRDPVPPHRRCRGRARPGDRRQTPGREVPAHRHHRRPGRRTCPGLALRPGCDRRRSRRGRLVRADGQPGARPGRPGRGLPPLQRPARR